jgi:hypothetical protein
MGKKTDSFNRELGKNTGKAVSNFLFGTKHATPVKLVRDAKIERIQEQQRIEKNLLLEKQEQETKRREQQEVAKMSHETESKISMILNKQFPTTESEFVVLMNDLKSHLYVHGWKSFFGLDGFNGKKNRINNKLSNVIFKKFQKGFLILANDYPNNFEINEYKKFIKITKIKKFIIQYWIFIIPIAFLIFIIILDFLHRTF